MGDQSVKDPMLDMYIFETSELTENLEEYVLSSEKEGSFKAHMNEIFRSMHTIKGNSAMMLFDNISTLAHSIEDLFDYFRKNEDLNIEHSEVVDLVLESTDFIKGELEKIKQGATADGDATELIERSRNCLLQIKNGNTASKEEIKEEGKETGKEDKKKQFYIAPEVKSAQSQQIYKATIHFESDCDMANVRAFTIVHNLKEQVEILKYIPEDIVESDESDEMIKRDGFIVFYKAENGEETVRSIIQKTSYVKDIEITVTEELPLEIDAKEENYEGESWRASGSRNTAETQEKSKTFSSKNREEGGVKVSASNMLNVSVSRLDFLMDLMGELVIAESMVTKNPDLNGLELDNFNKAARQLKKIINDIQGTVMAIRMVPLSETFRKMNRLIRDMNKKLGKEVELELIGEETEVDKNIIENIGDPLMHLIRNAMDHGIESKEDRRKKGKKEQGKITLEARNEGGDVCIFVRDDGAGLDRTKIYQKAYEHGLVNKPDEEYTDKEVYSFILLPGFSTKETVTEFSGRGVGMDVVVRDIEKIRGSIFIDSVLGQGTTITIKIPLTLAIIDGMNIRVGEARYTIPTTSIRQSFRLEKQEDLITDPEGNEMILVRNQCLPFIRLYKKFNIRDAKTEIEEGIIIIIENDEKSVGVFADELLEQQQVVVKALPSYIKKVRGIAGCTLLGDGSISLILDPAGLIQ